MVLPATEAVAPDTGAQERFAVIDIGSNSIRLVVYDRLSRVPTIVFNEKVLCGLGRGLGETGRLDEGAVSMALTNLARFVTLAREMPVARMDVVATAAVRDASNGREFVEMFEHRSGIKVRVASGAEEAELAAFGVRSGIPDARGVIGDLGGGSLELIRVEPDRMMDHATLPLGPLRLAAWTRRRPSNSAGRVDAYLRALPWLEQARGSTLYAVGGSWRAVARLHMAHKQYPLRVLHRFTVPYEEALEMASFIARKRGKHLAGLANVGKERLELTPLAAFVMERVLRVMQPAELTFSALGLREGVVFSHLSEAVRKQDPLIEECRDIAADRGRFPADGECLTAWMAPLFPGDGQEQQRRRLAACWLADIAWQEHPDYRADQAYNEVLRLPLLGADHGTRAAIALALYYRYTGKDNPKRTATAAALVSSDTLQRMKIVGQAARLGLTLSGGQARLLRSFALHVDDTRLTLEAPAKHGEMVGEVVSRRLSTLAQVVGRSPRVTIRQ